MPEPEYNEKFVEEILAADKQEPEGYLQPLPYAEPSKELQEMLNYIDEAMAELVKSIAIESHLLKDKVSAVHPAFLAAAPRFLKDKE